MKKLILKGLLGIPLPGKVLPITANTGFDIDTSNIGFNLDISEEDLSFLNTKKSKNIDLGNAVSSAGTVADSLKGIIPTGLLSKTTKNLNFAYDSLANGVATVPGFGTILSAGMKIGGFLGDGLTALGVGTDLMTLKDQIFDSNFLKLTPIGLINAIGAKKTREFNKDEELLADQGVAYSGTYKDIDEAADKAGKKYGLFSNKLRKEANNFIALLERIEDRIRNINNTAQTNFLAASYAGNSTRSNMITLGGYNALAVGRNGLKISPIHAKSVMLKYQRGGKALDPFLVYLNSLPLSQRDSTNYRVKDYWSFNGKPKNFEEAKQKGMFTLLEDGWHANSVAENPETGEIEFMKPSNHPTLHKELEWYNSDDGSEFRSLYELVKTQPYFKYIKRKQAVPTHKGGGSIIELITIPTEIELISTEELPEFLNGGSINVIPDGALHARKHNMDMDGITPKGIPVVSEKDGGEVEQQAEIEKEEIIFRLEVTQKLEELSRKYYDNDSTLKEKDAAALEAGLLLVKEILHNTIDNTNNLL